ncbi:MAG TPA: hypothetical protein VGL94_23810 [Ktedonobacteraceae bacterium]|jgi:ABC-type dipeptide/oligopeptide/nickel transport system ATPase component
MPGKQTFDGGQVAMIGFLYQIMGSIALRAWASRSNQVEGDELDALLGVIRDGELYHETGDIDVLVRQLGLNHPNAYVLIQFKYSQNPNKYPVTPGDLADICQNFLRNVEQWSQQRINVTSYRIITNRPISKTLLPVMNKPGGQRAHEQFNTPEIHNIVQKTEIIRILNFSDWTVALNSFASQYGIEPEEVRSGVTHLIGELAMRASIGSALPLEEKDLVKAFRGYEQKRKLTIAAIREYTAHQWEELRDKLGLQGMPVRRELFEDTMNKLRKHALIILCGQGGSGKSIMAWHLLRSMMEETSETISSAAVFLPAWNVQSHTLSWVVGEWSGTPEDRRNEPMEQALRRVRIANPHARPVFCLALDGLDELRESMPRETRIREVVEWFWQRECELRRASSMDPPDATLIVTCRESSIIISDWLQGALSQKMKNDPPTPIPIGNYSDAELQDAVELVMWSHAERFRQALAGQSISTITMRSTSLANIELPPVHPVTLKALYHPAMWYALRALSSEEQTRLLDGDVYALDRLAEQFLAWFYEKARKRRSDWDRDDIIEVLEAVALDAANIQAAEYPYNIWKNGRCRENGLDRTKVKRLYTEALSAGLIQEDQRRNIWYWRHPFVGQYLARKAQEEG